MSVRLSTDPDDVDLDVVASFLSRDSYWAVGRSREVVARSVAGSAVVVSALDDDGAMIGFARLVTDSATFAWLADVFVLPEWRGRGVGASLVEAAVGAPAVAGVTRVLLATADAHDLYGRFGFEPLVEPERWMVLNRENA